MSVLKIKDPVTGEWTPAVGGGSGSPNAVLYTEQTLTEEQKAQVRKNIGVELDTTLTVEGAAADSKTVGDILVEVINIIDSEDDDIPEQRIYIDGAMTVGRVDQVGRVYTDATDYMYTEKIKLNAKKTFQLICVNLNGVTVHPALRYVTPYDADGNVLSAYSLQNIPEASVSEGREITMDASVDSVIISIYKADDYTDKTVILPAIEGVGEIIAVPEQQISLDDTMSVGAYYNINGPDTTKTDYKYTEKIHLNATKSFQVTGVNLKGITVHIGLRYVVAFDADGNYLADYKIENIDQASIAEGRTITMDESVDSVIISIYKADDYTDKTIILLGREGSSGGSGVTTLKTEKLSGFEAVFSVDEICHGTHKSGVADFSDKRSICTRGFVKPFVTDIAVVSEDYQLAVVVYNNGAYVRTDSWYTNGSSYTFDHEKYQYKLYIMGTDNGYMHNFEAARLSVKLKVSTPDILYAYNALEAKQDAEHERMSKAMESMMRRNYDIAYANAPEPNGLIAYTGNNQIVHPKVLYFPNKFGGHRYWMAYTPYPWAIDTYENPCVAYSDDGYEWTNIDGNPLDDPNGDGYNSDTHLVYVESTGTLEVWYRYVGEYDTTPVPEILYRQTSTDGVNWTAKEVVVNNTSGDYVRYLSPAVIHDGSVYKMWVVNSTDNTINYYESEAGIPEEIIALDDAMTEGAIMQQGNLNPSTDYMHTEKIKLNATKSFQLTAVNLNGITVHPVLRYVTAYDADGNVLTDYSQQSIAEASVSAGRIITMDESVDSVIISIYKAQNYTNKTIVLPAVESDGELTKVRDITLAYQGEGKTYTLWHIDVIEDNGKTVLLAMCKSGTDWSLFLSTSEDNVTFTAPELVMVGNPYGWDTRLYRSSIVNVNDEYRIYYTAQNEMQKYGLGICTSNALSNFVGKW